MIRHFFSRQFLAFLLTGGFAAVVNFSSRIYYMQWLDFSSAVIAAYITGMFTAFILAKLFVFRKSQQKLHHSILFFILVNVLAAAQTWGISMGMAYYALPWLNPWLEPWLQPWLDVNRYSHEIAHATGVAAPVFTSYLGHKHWSFRSA
jgi:putative flippase GtrA